MFVLLSVFLSYAMASECPNFDYSHLSCVNSRTAERSYLTQFKKIERPTYDVVVFEQGSRLRTLVLPFTQYYPNGIVYSLFCESGVLKTSQTLGGRTLESQFEFNGHQVIQSGQIFESEAPGSELLVPRPFEVICETNTL